MDAYGTKLWHDDGIAASAVSLATVRAVVLFVTIHFRNRLGVMQSQFIGHQVHTISPATVLGVPRRKSTLGSRNMLSTPTGYSGIFTR